MDEPMVAMEHPHGNRGETSARPPQASEREEKSSHANPLLPLLDLTDWAYFRLDTSGHLIDTSQRLADLLSTTSDALIGVPLASLCVPPYDILLSRYLLPADSSHAGRVKADRLRLFLSLRASPPAENRYTHQGELPPDKSAQLSARRADTGSSKIALEPDVKTIPVELVAIYSGPGIAAPATEETTILGLLRPIQEADRTSREEVEAQSHSIQHQQQNIRRQLHAILQIGQRVATSEDLDTLLSHVVRSLNQELHYPYADVFLLSDDNVTAILRASSSRTQTDDPDASRTTAVYVQHQFSEQDILGLAAASTEPILINDIDKQFDALSFLHRPGAKSALAVPLIVSAGVVGILVVQNDTPDAFTLDDVILLQILGDHIAIAIENTSLLDERDQHLAELAALRQIGMLLASPGELMDTLNAIIRQVNALFQVEAASLMLVEDGRLYFKVAAGTHIDEIKPYAMDMGQGIAGWAVQHNQTVRVNDVTTDSRHYAGIDDTIDFETRSLIAVPLRIAKRPDNAPQRKGEEKVIGVIEIINRIDGRPFTRRDEILIEFIASSAAVVIENVRLFNELQHRLAEVSALLETSRATTTLELQAVLDKTVEHVSTALDAEQAVIYLLDADNQRLIPHATSSRLQEEYLQRLIFTLGQGTVGRIAETRRPLHTDNARTDPHYLGIAAPSDKVRSTLGVPLTVQNELIGVLEVVNKKGQRHFTPADEALLSAFGGQVALAIHNARLYRETQRRVEDLAALGRASEAINRTLSLDEILRAAVQAAAALVSSQQGVALLLREEQTDHLSLALCQGFETVTPDALKSIRLGESDHEGVRLVHDFLAPESSTYASQTPTPLISVPLRGREEAIGLIILAAPLPPFETAGLLQTLGDMVAIAVEKARLHEETRRRLAEVSTLYTLANQITTVLDLNRILETTVTIISHALDCQGCCLHLHDSQTGELTLQASSGWGRGEREAADLELINQVSRRVLREGHPTNLTDAQSRGSANVPQSSDTLLRTSDKGESASSSIRSLLVVPLITKNTLIGTLSIDDQAPEAFGMNEGRLLTIAAAQVSVAIENARLLRNLHDRALQLEQALEELRELHRLKTEFLQNVSHELRTPLTFIKSYVQLILEGAMGEINPDLQGPLAIVDQRTDAVIRLVNDVISLEQMDMGKYEFQPVSLVEVATRAVQGAAMAAKKSNISIELQAGDDLPLLHADPGRLGQVFDNLLGNAIKFSPAGKTITVRVGRDGAFARADVEDQGIGIPADKLDQIFDRFYQVDGSTTRRYGGTGLGLAIVKSIVESHGGQIIVESALGAGSTFSFILPIPRSADNDK
jgi:GAF domain-containing protein